LKPNLRHKRKVLSGFEGLLEIVGLEVMADSVRAGTHSEGWKETVPDCSRSCNTKTAGTIKLQGHLNITAELIRWKFITVHQENKSYDHHNFADVGWSKKY